MPIGVAKPYAYAEDYHGLTLGIENGSYIRRADAQNRSLGSAIAFTSADASSDLPILKAGAYTPPNERGRYVTSYAYASTLFAYTYNGPTPIPLPLVGNIDFSITYAPINYSNPLGPGSYPYSYGQARSRLVVGTADLWQGHLLSDADLTCGAPGVLAADAQTLGRGGYAVGAVAQSLTMTLDTTLGCDGHPLTLAPQQQIYIYGFLETLAIHGATVDATHSFHVNFAPGTAPAVVEALSANLALSVPEPASWGMLIGGLGVIGARMRRRRRVALAVG
ncbi:PEPxxWA-CTERM sorting domain-containing protein [Sphingomonas antarctica]|uniref:PEPxxWA-CTERM sorting domain-containing protein n=1 Tax=Sphingomonas antarctica TaxID=2040274 RepID=UPI0039EA1DCF